MSFLTIALLSAVAVSAVIVVVLAMEIACELDVDTTRDDAVIANVRLLGGLVAKTIRSGDDAKEAEDSGKKADESPDEDEESGAEDDDAAKKPKKSVSERLHTLRRGWAAIQAGGLTSETLGFVGRLWRAFGVRDVQVRVHVGLEDPAATGELWGMTMPLVLLARSRDVDVEVVPFFDGELLDVRGEGTLRTRPLHVIAVCVGVVFRPRIIQAAWAAVRAK